jgi:hypothetical protein
MPLDTLFPSSIDKDGPEKPSDKRTYHEIEWGFYKLFMQHVKVDKHDESAIHNFSMVIYEPCQEIQTVSPFAKIKYGDGDLCIWVAIGIAPNAIQSKEDFNDLLSVWKLTSTTLLNPCVQIYKQMRNDHLDVSPYLTDGSVPWELLKTDDGNQSPEDQKESDVEPSIATFIFDSDPDPNFQPGSTAGSSNLKTEYDIPRPVGRAQDCGAILDYMDPEPVFAGGEFIDPKTCQTDFGGHSIAIRWGYHPGSMQKVLDIVTNYSPGRDLPEAEQTYIPGAASDLAINIGGYSVRSYKSTCHLTQESMKAWLMNDLTQQILCEQIQKHDTSGVRDLVAGSDETANNAVDPESNYGGSRSSETAPSGTRLSKPPSSASTQDSGLRSIDSDGLVFTNSLKRYKVKSNL